MEPEFSKIRQNPAKPGQKNQGKKPWISLDSLGGNECFQVFALTPQGKKTLSRIAARRRPNLRAIAKANPLLSTWIIRSV
jgi:hypothetical protein